MYINHRIIGLAAILFLFVGISNMLVLYCMSKYVFPMEIQEYTLDAMEVHDHDRCRIIVAGLLDKAQSYRAALFGCSAGYCFTMAIVFLLAAMKSGKKRCQDKLS